MIAFIEYPNSTKRENRSAMQPGTDAKFPSSTMREITKQEEF